MRTWVRIGFALNLFALVAVTVFFGVTRQEKIAFPMVDLVDHFETRSVAVVGEALVVMNHGAVESVFGFEALGLEGLYVCDVALAGENRLFLLVEDEFLTLYECDLQTGSCRLLEKGAWLSAFHGPAKLSYFPGNQRVYLSISKSHQIFRFDPEQPSVFESFSVPGGVVYPNGMDAVADGIWIADTNHHRVRFITYDSVEKQSYEFPKGAAGWTHAYPLDVAVNENGDLLVIVANGSLMEPQLVLLTRTGEVRERLFPGEDLEFSQVASAGASFLLGLAEPPALKRVVVGGEGVQIEEPGGGAYFFDLQTRFEALSLRGKRLLLMVMICFVVGFGLAALDGLLGTGRASSGGVVWVGAGSYTLKTLWVQLAFLLVPVPFLWYLVPINNNPIGLMAIAYLLIFVAYFANAWSLSMVAVGTNGEKIFLRLANGKVVEDDPQQFWWCDGMLGYQKYVVRVLNGRGEYLLDRALFQEHLLPLLSAAKREVRSPLLTFYRLTRIAVFVAVGIFVVVVLFGFAKSKMLY